MTFYYAEIEKTNNVDVVLNDGLKNSCDFIT